MPSDINAFIRERSPRWQRLEEILRLASQNRWKGMSEAQAREFGVLYRATCSDLLQAQTEIRNAEMVQFLNDLVARSYSVLYAEQGRTRLASVRDFYARDFPRLFRRTLAYFLVSLALFLAGGAFGFLAGAADPDSVLYFVPEEMASFRTADEYLERKGQFGGGSGAAAFTSVLFSNNLRVSFMAFASGLLVLGPLAFMFYNGAVLGSFGALFHLWGRSFTFWSLIVPHGMLEMTACLIAGQAGLVLASGLLFPGELTRLDALRRRGADAVRLVLGCAPMTVIAAVLEAYVSPLPASFLPEWGKMSVALVTSAAAIAYLCRAGRGAEGEERERLRDLMLREPRPGPEAAS